MAVELPDPGSHIDLPPAPFLLGGLEATADGLLLLDAEGRVRYHNRRLAEILDVPDERMAEMAATDAAGAASQIFLHPDRLRELVEREQADPELVTHRELRLTDGRIVQRHARPLRVGDQVLGRVISLRDVTDLRDHERNLEHAQRLAGTGSWEWDIPENEVSWSDQIYRIFDLDPETLGADYEAFLDRVHPEDRDRVHDVVEEGLETGAGYEPTTFRIVTPEGEVHHVRSIGEVVTDGDGRPSLYRGVLQDVTELEETRRELKQAEQRYRTLFEVTPLALVVSRPSGEIVTVNDRFESLMGYGAEDVAGRDARDLDIWVDLDDRREVLAKLEEEGVVRDHSSVLRTATGEKPEVELSVDQVRLDGEPYLTWAIRDVTSRNRYRRELEQKALYDDLTGLPNRPLLFDRLEHAREVAVRDNEPLTVLFVDLDDFKAVNDSYGHAAGDRLLAEAATRMSSALRERDTLARMGGDEFVAILENTGKDGAFRAAERIVRALTGAPFEVADKELSISATVGVAQRSEDLDDRASLLRAADAALQQAKTGAGSRGPIHLFGPGDETRQFRLQKKGRLQEALEAEEFELYYQPVVDLQHGERIVGAEALIRWNHPERGLVPPGEFIPLAEETGLISDLDRWSLRRATEQKVRWQENAVVSDLEEPFSVAVNVSAPLYQSPGFGDEVQAILAETGLSPSALQLEITERLSVSNMGTWGRLRREGVRLAIDDFGTGYSSLRYLRDLDADVLKVDQYFTQDLTDEPDRTSVILKAVVAVGSQMGIDLIAEGVETEAQRDHLTAIGYRYAQGYLFARPMPADDFEQLLGEGEA